MLPRPPPRHDHRLGPRIAYWPRVAAHCHPQTYSIHLAAAPLNLLSAHLGCTEAPADPSDRVHVSEYAKRGAVIIKKRKARKKKPGERGGTYWRRGCRCCCHCYCAAIAAEVGVAASIGI